MWPQMVLMDIGQTPGDFFFFFKKNLYHTRFSLANSQNKDFGLTLEIIITVHFFLFYPFLTSQLCWVENTDDFSELKLERLSPIKPFLGKCFKRKT